MEMTTVSLDKQRRDGLAQLRDELTLPHYDATIEYLLQQVDAERSPIGTAVVETEERDV